MKFAIVAAVLALYGLVQASSNGVPPFKRQKLNQMLSSFNPETTPAKPGWIEHVATIPENTRWVIVGDVKPDWFMNVIVHVKRFVDQFDNKREIGQLLLKDGGDIDAVTRSVPWYEATVSGGTKVYFADAPLKYLIEQMATSPKLKETALEMQKKVHEKTQVWRTCPHAFIVNIGDFGQYGSRNLFGRDAAELIPDDWMFDPVRDEHLNTLQVVCNRAGDKFKYPPGAQVNVGVTPHIYDPSNNKMLELVEMHFKEDPDDKTKLRVDEGRVLGKPSGNIDLAKDMRPFSEYPFLSEMKDSKMQEMGGKYLDPVHGALREFIEETGLHLEQVQAELPVEAQLALWNLLHSKDVKLLQCVEWLGNSLAPSINLHFLFEADGFSSFDAKYFMGDVNEGVKGIRWVDPSEKELIMINHAFNFRHSPMEPGKQKGQTLITSANPNLK